MQPEWFKDGPVYVNDEFGPPVLLLTFHYYQIHKHKHVSLHLLALHVPPMFSPIFDRT